MRIQLLSDLHLESRMMRKPLAAADIVVLAGDVWEGGESGIEWAMEMWPFVQVLYVPGNHEYYGGDYDERCAILRAIASEYPNLAWLDSGMNWTVIDRIALFGCTLWTDFMYDAPGGDLLKHHASLAEAAEHVPDYQSIQIDGRQLMPEDTTRLFEMQHNHLRRLLRMSSNELARLAGVDSIRKRVVITHHAPSVRSVHTKYANSPLTPSFASRLDDTVMLADLWIHGHTHDSCDYLLTQADGHDTRVVCNPRGYSKGRKNENRRFKPQLVIEV